MSKVLKSISGTPENALKLGDFEIQCYVLEDETRVLVQSGLTRALGMSTGGGTGGVQRIVQFAQSKAIKPMISNDLMARIENPIKFRLSGGGTANGYEATILADICEAVIKARQSGSINPQQKHIVDRAEMLLMAFAKVGITALVDEATGYQEIRERNALHKILEAYISPTLLPWTKRFPNEFYKEMFRLNGWAYDPSTVKRPGVIGTWTNKLIYEQLPPGVLDELKSKTPKGKHLHRFLTTDIGHPNLSNQLAAVTAIMRMSPNWRIFMQNFAKAFKTGQLGLDLGDETTD